MRWAEAVKIWNTHKKSVNASHVYCLPRKGTPEHAHVKHIQMGGHPEEFKQGPVSSKKFLLKAFRERQEAAEKRVAARKIEAAAAPKAPAEKMETPKKFVFKKKAEREAEAKRKEDAEVMGEKAKRKKVRSFLKAALERRRTEKAAAEARVAETGKKLKGEKVKAFLKAALERRRRTKEVGRRVLENPDLQRLIPGAEYLTAEYERAAKSAMEIEKARREALKNEALTEMMENLFSGYYLTALLFPKMRKELIGDRLVDGRYVLHVEGMNRGGYYDGEYSTFDVEKALKPFEHAFIYESQVDASRNKAGELSDYHLEALEEWLRSEGELGPREVFKEYTLYGVLMREDEELEGDDKKFMEVYLKKKFGKTLEDVRKEGEDELKRRKEIKAEKKAEKTAAKAAGSLEGLSKAELMTIIKNWETANKKRFSNLSTKNKEGLIELIKKYEMPQEAKASAELEEKEALVRRISAFEKSKGARLALLRRSSVEALRRYIEKHSIP